MKFLIFGDNGRRLSVGDRRRPAAIASCNQRASRPTSKEHRRSAAAAARKCSAQRPNATDGAIRATRRAAGLPVLTAGAGCRTSIGATPHHPVAASLLDQRSGVLAPLHRAAANRGTGKPKGHDANKRQSGRTARRMGSRVRIAII
jgi:hypothetical protein